MMQNKNSLYSIISNTIIYSIVFLLISSINGGQSLASESLMIFSQRKCVLLNHLTETQCDIAAQKSRQVFLKIVPHFNSRESCEQVYGRMKCAIDAVRGRIVFIPQQDNFHVSFSSHGLMEVVPHVPGAKGSLSQKSLHPILPADAVTELPSSKVYQKPALKSNDPFKCSDYVEQDPGAPADAGCLPRR